MKQYKRTDRLQEQILRDVSSLVDQPLKEHAGGLLTFTRVKVTADLRYATVYYSFLGSDEDRRRAEGFLEREKGKIRSGLGRGLRTRNVPELTFKFDPSVEESIRIEQLFEQIKNEGNKNS